MAMFTFESTNRDTQKKSSASNLDSKIVNIEEYRRTVLLPARRASQTVLAFPRWSSSDPLSAA